LNILAIDTCTDIASVTLYKSGEFTSRVLSGVEKTSGHILKLCDEVFKESKTQLNEVDLISYSKGPGSFTGVRMCIGVVQGLSLSNNHFDKPILLEGYLLSSNSNTALGVLGLTSLVGES